MSHNNSFNDLNNGLLLAYLDDAVDAETRRRIEAELNRSPALRQELDHLARLQSTLMQSLSHATSPTQLELGEYALGVVGPVEVERIERQLAAYPHLASEVKALRAYLSDLDLPPADTAAMAQPVPLRERITLIVARLVEGLAGAGGPSMALAGVRGLQVAERTYEIDDGQLIVAVQENTEKPETRDILGLAIGLTDDYEYWVSLYQAEQKLAAASMDAFGNFVINAVRPDIYSLVLSSVAQEIVVPALVVE